MGLLCYTGYRMCADGMLIDVPSASLRAPRNFASKRALAVVMAGTG